MLRRSSVWIFVVIVAAIMSTAACDGSSSHTRPTTTPSASTTGSPATGSSTTSAPAPKPVKPAPSAATPQVTGPLPEAGLPKIFSNYSLSKVGYAESEYLISGKASAYSPVSRITSNGRWTVKPTSTARYKTRLIVARPSDPSKFSGTVVVEWLNVTSGSDSDVDWSYGHNEMIRSGDAYVGVSAQAIGVSSAKSSDPSRYGSLVHPGDSYAYDIYSQAGMAIRTDANSILGGLKPTLLLADGESQSAIYMTTYVDAVAPLVNVYDGYMIHSRSGGSAPIAQAPLPAVATPSTVFVRTDLTVPVLTVASETDVLGVLHFLPARQPDTRFVRLWEIAGTAHVDSYVALKALDDDGSRSSDVAQFKLMSSPTKTLRVSLASGPLVLNCKAPFNSGEHHYVFDTALADLTQWARTGTPPRSMPRLSVDESVTPAKFNLDGNGNVIGGIRTPAVDVPVAQLSGLEAPGGPSFCEFFGQTHPFSSAKLAALYPTHQDFVRKWLAAVTKDRDAGYLLPADAAKLASVVQP